MKKQKNENNGDNFVAVIFLFYINNINNFLTPLHSDKIFMQKELKIMYKSKYPPENHDDFVAQISKKVAASVKPAEKDTTKISPNKAEKHHSDEHFDFDKSKLFSLKFAEDAISFEKVKKRAERYNLPILYTYSDFAIERNTVQSDYRNCYPEILKGAFKVTFLNDVEIPDNKVSKIMQKALINIFPEAYDNEFDNANDCTGFYTYDPLLKYYDKSLPEINIESLIRNMSLYMKDTRGDTHYKKYLKEFSEVTGVALTSDNFLDISIIEKAESSLNENNIDLKNGKIPTNSIIILSKDVENLPNIDYIINLSNPINQINIITNSSGNQKKSKIPPEYRSAILKDITSNCQLFREFESNDRRLNEDELFGLATNINKIYSGAKKFKDVLCSNSYYEEQSKKYSDWAFYLTYTKNYAPKSCNSFCPYKENCPHGVNILKTSKPKYNEIIRFFEPELVDDIEEAVADFRSAFQKAIDSTARIWHIIKAQTALGKTRIYLAFIKNTSLRILIVVPTVILKNEVCERAKKNGTDIIESPSIQEIKDDLPDDIWNDIQDLYARGLSVIPYMKKQIEEDNARCARFFRKYLRDLDAFNNFDGQVAITTHKRFFSMDKEIISSYDLVIVDEDPIYGSIIPNRCEITIQDLKKLREKIPDNALTRKIKKAARLAKTEPTFSLDKIDYDNVKDDCDGIKMAVDIPAFCRATSFCLKKVFYDNDDLSDDISSADSIVFIKPVEIPDKTKIIVVSATVDEYISKLVFGENKVRFYNCKQAINTGQLNQYPEKTMSRACISKNPDIIDYIRDWSGNRNAITFKKYSMNKSYNDAGLHFGNTAGCDTLKGENLDIIGSCHQTDWIYKLFAHSLGLDFDEDAILKNLTVDHNGYRFRFNTYDDEILRKIQFYMIESELEQAVGRARLLRCDCTVNLFSNFPLSQANFLRFDWDKYDKKDDAKGKE